MTSLLGRLPLSTWTEIPFKDDWTPLFQQAVNGAGLLRRGVVVGWNWWFLGGYPTSTDIAQNFGTLALLPMALFGDRLGYHVLHAVLFLAVPLFVWWDLRDEDRETRVVATAFACFFASGYFGTIGSSGDTNSLVGVFCAGLALIGGHSARLGRRWGGPLMLAGLTLALYTHAAFFVYAGIFLTLDALYFRDRAAMVRVIVAGACAGVAALPVHWESLRFPEYVSFNNTVYAPGGPFRWSVFARTFYYNVEILLLPHRWFNDYRSLANVWLPALVIVAAMQPRSRDRLLRVGGGPHPGAAPLEHASGRGHLRSHPAHVPVARRAGACGIRVAAGRHARPGDRDGGRDRAVRSDVTGANPPCARPPRLRSGPHRSRRCCRRQHGPRRDQPASRHGQPARCERLRPRRSTSTSRVSCRGSPASGSTAR